MDHDDDFVRDIEEESLEHDVERQIDQTIAAYNRKKDKDTYDYFPADAGKQKVPSKGRIESAKPNIGAKRDQPLRFVESANADSTQRRKGQQTKKEMFYERFSDYVKQNHITPEDFWNASKEKLSSDEFRECLDTIGFSYGKEEFEDVIFDITDANFFVTLQTLCSKIKHWESFAADKTLEALKDNVLKIAQESRKKLTSAESAKTGLLVRPQSGALYSPSGALLPTSARPFSGISMISSKSKQSMMNTHTEYNRMGSADTFKKTNYSYENKSNKYLQQAKKKEAKKDQILALTISKAKNEFEYSCLAKMGEANEISQGLGETITYRAYNAADGHLKCHVYNYDKLVAELSMKDFVREYKALRQKQFQKQNLKIWEVLNQEKGGNSNYYFSSNKAEQNENMNDDNQRRNVAKKDRQKELKAVLFETMKLTNTLKSQLEKLEKSGLVYEAQPAKY